MSDARPDVAAAPFPIVAASPGGWITIASANVFAGAVFLLDPGPERSVRSAGREARPHSG